MQAPKIIEDVVIVIHNDDVDLFCLQLKSLDLFLEKCRLHIVINEKDVNYCYKKITPSLLRSIHTTKIWTRLDILGSHPNVPGWTSQQLLKLLIPLKKDWISLDCKDIFVKPVRLDELDRKQYKDYASLDAPDPQSAFWQGLLALGKEHNFPVIESSVINQNQTPRVVDNRVIRKINQMFGNKQAFINWFCSFKVQGEYILHDYIAEVLELEEKMRFPRGFIAGIWYDHVYESNPVSGLPDNMHIYKCHRRVFNDDRYNSAIIKWVERVFKTYRKYRDALKND